ncbi:MAG: hypothetical protein JSW50_06575 [Candidatus Latescibacterota bacterium]|nr:MAG: hypothetical protein JSW50_06575 [Candidatus Latescibacterota bacterium]
MVIDRKHIVAGIVVMTFLAAIAGEASAQSLRTLPVAEPSSRAIGQENTEFKLPDDPAFLQNGEEKAISPAKAMMYSFLLPGLGQWRTGNKGEAKIFFSIEAAIWVSFAVFMVQGYVREEDYKEFAQVFAGIESTDHSDDFYSTIGEYNSWVNYEAFVKSEGRFEFYPNVDAQILEDYWIENRVADYEPWVWQSADIRRNFRDQRSASRLSYRRALYAVAAAVLNRLASGFFAIRSANVANRTEAAGYRLEVGAPWVKPNEGFRTGLSVVKTF